MQTLHTPQKEKVSAVSAAHQREALVVQNSLAEALRVNEQELIDVDEVDPMSCSRAELVDALDRAPNQWWRGFYTSALMTRTQIAAISDRDF